MIPTDTPPREQGRLYEWLVRLHRFLVSETPPTISGLWNQNRVDVASWAGGVVGLKDFGSPGSQSYVATAAPGSVRFGWITIPVPPWFDRHATGAITVEVTQVIEAPPVGNEQWPLTIQARLVGTGINRGYTSVTRLMPVLASASPGDRRTVEVDMVVPFERGFPFLQLQLLRTTTGDTYSGDAHVETCKVRSAVP